MHTPEPWIYQPVDPIYRQGPHLVWGPEGPGHGILADTSPHGQATKSDEANARRIVACVNACVGIPTKLLENLQPSVLYKLLRDVAIHSHNLDNAVIADRLAPPQKNNEK